VKVAVASDHAGFELKCTLSAWLLEMGHEVFDVGAFSEERVDYPGVWCRAWQGRFVRSGCIRSCRLWKWARNLHGGQQSSGD